MNKDFEQRVVNLLKQAEDRKGTPEGDTFQAKAMELIAKYNFDAAALRDKSQGKAEIGYEIITPKGHHIKSQIMMYTALCQEHSCIAMLMQGTNDLKIYGTDDSIRQVKWLFGLLWPSALSQALAVKPRGERYTKGDVTVARRSFLYGFIVAVRDRLREANKSAEQHREGAGLVLMDDAKRARAKLYEDHPNVKKSNSSRQINGEAMGRGKVAGQRSDIGQTRVQNNRRAIGA